MIRCLCFAMNLSLLAVLAAGIAFAQQGLPDNLNPDRACPLPQNDWQTQSRTQQIQGELGQIIQNLSMLYDAAARVGYYSPWAQARIAQLTQRKQVLDYELFALNQRAAWLAQERPACLTRLREARLGRLGTVPASDLRLIPEKDRLPEEQAAIAAADAAAAAELAAQKEAARQKAEQDTAAQEQAAVEKAGPSGIRQILSAHLCNWKRQLAISDAQNKSIYYKGHIDDDVYSWKQFIEANARKFKEFNTSPLPCTTKRMKVLLNCLPSVYDMDGSVFTVDMGLCLSEDDALIKLDELMTKHQRLDVCLDNGIRTACRAPAPPGGPTAPVATASGLTPEAVLKIGLSSTKVALSARKCLFSEELRALAKKPDPTAETPETWRALLSAVNQQLADAKLKPVACEDREIKTAMQCLGSILGGRLNIPLWCTNDVFMRDVIRADAAIGLGVKLPEEKGTFGEAEEKAQAALRKLGIEAEILCVLRDNRRAMKITVVSNSSGCVGDCILRSLTDALGTEYLKGQYHQLIVQNKGDESGHAWTRIFF